MWSNYMTGGTWWGMGLYMGVFWLLLIAVVLAAVFAGTRRRSSGPEGTPRERPALRILEERYARGEIDKDEFQQKRRDLGL